MNQNLALRILSEIMRWDADRAREEFAWLRLMSRLKYDGYRDYLAGARFIESLADWLQQFEPSERESAYQFVRHHLVYLGPAEIQHLVELAYSDTIQPRLLQAVAEQLQIPTYRVWSEPDAIRTYKTLLRKTLFLGLSDGARIDTFRRVNTGVISNEQVVLAPQINDSKWRSLLGDLRNELQDESARFAFVYLLDDFTASGATLLRPENGEWKGKLPRFWVDTRSIAETHFEPNWVLGIHHYIATHRASSAIEQAHTAMLETAGPEKCFQRVEFSFGTVLPSDLPIDADRYGDFMPLIKKYYDPAIETKHTEVGGSDVRLGFAECALPVVLEHNTPNNSIALLWAETDGADGHHAMRPLFRRRQRHL